MKLFVLRCVLTSLRVAGLSLFTICLIGGFAFGQQGMACHTMEMREPIAPEKLPAPQKLMGIGNSHIRVTGSAEAQAWFDQGLNLLHDFWDYESARAFEQSVRVDPSCAMCYWGMYQAEKFYHRGEMYYAGQMLKKADELKRHASKAERLYIEASVAAEAAEKADKKDGKSKKDKTETVAIYRKLVKQNPRDMQARIFLAEALIDGYDDDGQPRAGQKEALEILQGVLKVDPNDSAANHYWIHATEASPHPEQALHSAEILGSLAPTSGHMVHMPGHIFYRTGDYASAEKSFADSTAADEQYMRAQNVAVDDDWNYVHNLMYAIANLLEAGEFSKATALSGKLKGARGELANTLYTNSPRDAMSRIDPGLPVALRTADWASVLRMAKSSDTALPNLKFLAGELSQFALGMSALERGDASAAEAASVAFDAELWRMSNRAKDEADTRGKEKAKNKDQDKKGDQKAPEKLKVMPDALPDPLVRNLSVMSLELRAGLLMVQKRGDEAKKLFAQAAREEKALGYYEPPAYVRPAGEAAAAAFMAAADWEDASAAYKQALAERPRSGLALYGIALASERAGDVTAASAEYKEFLSAWKLADAELPQVAHAREYLAAHGTSAGE